MTNLPNNPPAPGPETIEERLRNARSNFQNAFKDFHALLKDKVLVKNKSEASKKVEKFVVDKIVKACITVNNLNVGEGIMALSVSALRELLALRDRINDLEYEITELKRKAKKNE